MRQGKEIIQRLNVTTSFSYLLSTIKNIETYIMIHLELSLNPQDLLMCRDTNNPFTVFLKIETSKDIPMPTLKYVASWIAV